MEGVRSSVCGVALGLGLTVREAEHDCVSDGWANSPAYRGRQVTARMVLPATCKRKVAEGMLSRSWPLRRHRSRSAQASG